MSDPREPNTSDPNTNGPVESEDIGRNAKKDEEGKRMVDPRDHDELNSPDDDGGYAKQGPGPQPGGGDESGHS